MPLASAVTFLSFLDNNLLIPIMALFASSLGAGPGIIGLVVGMYSITNTPSNILSGWLIDRVGYRLPLIAGLAIAAVSVFSYSLVGIPAQLALVRAIHGIGGGLVAPAPMSIIASYSGGVPRGKAMSFYGMALAFATLIGFALSGVIVSRLGYDFVFYVGAGTLVAAIAVSLLLPRPMVKGGKPLKPLTGIHVVQMKELLRRKGLTVSYSSIFAQYFAFGGIVTLLPLRVQDMGMTAFHVGMSLTAFTVMFIIVQFPSGSLSDKLGRLKLIVAGLALAVVSVVMLPWAPTFAMLVAAMGLYGVAFGFLFPSVSALVADRTAFEERGMAMGIFHALLTAGVAVGALAIGWVGEGFGIRVGLLASASALAVALLVALRALKRG